MKTRTKRIFLSLFAFAALTIAGCSVESNDPGNTPDTPVTPTPTPGGGGDDPDPDPDPDPQPPGPVDPPAPVYVHLEGTLAEGSLEGPVFVHAYDSYYADTIKQDIQATVTGNKINFTLNSNSYNKLIVVELDENSTSIAADWSNVNKESSEINLPATDNKFDFSLRLHPRGEADDELQIWGTYDGLAWGKLGDIVNYDETYYQATLNATIGTEFKFHTIGDAWLGFDKLQDTLNGQYQKFEAKGGEDSSSSNNIVAKSNEEFTFQINKTSGEIEILGGTPPVVVSDYCVYGLRAGETDWKEFGNINPLTTTDVELNEGDVFTVHLTGNNWLNYTKVTGDDGKNPLKFEALGGEDNPDNIKVLASGTYKFSISARNKLVIGNELDVKSVKFTVSGCPKTYEGQEIYLLGTVNDWKVNEYYKLTWISGDEDHSEWSGTFDFDYETVGYKFVLVTTESGDQAWEVNGEGNERLLTVDGSTPAQQLTWGQYERALPSYNLIVNEEAPVPMVNVTDTMGYEENKFAEYKLTLNGIKANDVLSFKDHNNDLPEDHFIFESECNVNPETGAVINGGTIVVVLKLYNGDDGTYYKSWVSDPLSTITAKLDEADLPLVDIKDEKSTNFAEYEIKPTEAAALSFKKDGEELKITGVNGVELEPGPQSSYQVNACTGEESYKIYITQSFEIWIIGPDYVDPATLTSFKVLGTIGGENKWAYKDGLVLVNDDENKLDGTAHQWKAEFDLVENDGLKLCDGKGTEPAWLGFDKLEANANFKEGENQNIMLNGEEGHYTLYLKIDNNDAYSIYIYNPQHVVNAYLGNEVLTPNAELTNPVDNMLEYTLIPEVDGELTLKKDTNVLNITGVNGVPYGEHQPSKYDVKEGVTYGIYVKKDYTVWLTDPEAPEQVVPPCVHLGKGEFWSDKQLVAIDPDATNVEYTAVLDLEADDVFIINFNGTDWRGFAQIKAGSPAYSNFALEGENDIKVTKDGRYRISVETNGVDGKYIWIVEENSVDAYLGEIKLTPVVEKSNPSNLAEYIVAPSEAKDLTFIINDKPANITKVDGATPTDPSKLTVRACEGEESYKIYVTDGLEIHIITPDYVPPEVEYRDVIIDAGSLKGSSDYVYAWVWKTGETNGQWVKADAEGKVTFNKDFDNLIPVVSTKELTGTSWDGVKAKSYNDIKLPAYEKDVTVTLTFAAYVDTESSPKTAYFVWDASNVPSAKGFYLVANDDTAPIAKTAGPEDVDGGQVTQYTFAGVNLEAGDLIHVLEKNDDGSYYYYKGIQSDCTETGVVYENDVLSCKTSGTYNFYLKIRKSDSSKWFWIAKVS